MDIREWRFSNPLVYLIAACGWNCLRTAELNRRKIFVYFGLLLAAALTRHINALLAACLPIALLPLAGKELIRRSAAANLANGKSRYRSTRRLLIFAVVGLSAIGTSVLVQQTMCWLFRVPFRSTFGETLSYRLSYLEVLPEQERTAILGRISAKLADPVVTEAFAALNRSLKDWKVSRVASIDLQPLTSGFRPGWAEEEEKLARRTRCSRSNFGEARA